MSMISKFKWVAAALLIFSSLVILRSYIFQATSEDLNVPQGGDFSLETIQGNFSSKDQRGKTIFLFFGFTRCPHVCPTTLQTLEKMQRNLPAQLKDKVSVLFISVDNKRDTIPVLRDHFKDQSKHFYAGTANDKKLQEILKMYGAFSSIIPNGDDYSFDHTSDVFVINPQGTWVDKIDFRASEEIFTKAVKASNSLPPFWSERRQMRLQEMLGENQDCDLAKKKCSIDLGERGFFSVEFRDFPIETEKDLKIYVTSTSQDFTPVAADFSGVDLNMGFIRPELELIKENTFAGDFYLPVCELTEMKWRVKVILKDKNSFHHKLNFSFTTKNQDYN